MSDQLLQTIETIYDCIGNRFDHPRALETYSQATGDTGFMLAEIRPLLGGFGKYYSHNIPDHAVAAIPATPGGLGTRETAAIFLLGVLGVAETRAVPLSLLVYGAVLFWSLFGGIIYMMYVAQHGKRVEEALEGGQ